MKKTFAVVALILGLGFTIGWLARPISLPVAAQAVEAPAPVKPVGKVDTAAAAESVSRGKRAQRDPVAKKPDGMPTNEQLSQAKKMQAEMFKAVTQRQRDKLDNQIEKLSENLTLTDEQKAMLATWLDGRMKNLEDMDITDLKSVGSIPAGLVELTSKGLEDQLAPTLTDDQQTAFVDFKDREHRSKVDTIALKGLAKLQGVIEFEDGQRDAVYKVLTQAAESTVAAEDAAPNFARIMNEGMGIETDPYDLGIEKAMKDSIWDTSKMANLSGKGMAANMRDTINKRIEQKIDQLRPILNDKQLDLYHNELKTKGMGPYGTVLSTMENLGE